MNTKNLDFNNQSLSLSNPNKKNRPKSRLFQAKVKVSKTTLLPKKVEMTANVVQIILNKKTQVVGLPKSIKDF
jgi:hypothetical protein